MIVIKIEYYTKDKMLNFELFNDIEKAYKFYKSADVFGVEIVKANDKYIYFEENGVLNYEDKAGLIK